jgi:hypothetical protein
VTRVSLAAGVAVAAVLLTGCGAVPDLNPGAAAQVGDETVTEARVRDVAADYCPAIAPQLQGQAIALNQLNARVAGSLALRAAGDQFAAEEGVEADPGYQDAIDSADAAGQFKGMSAAEKDAFIEVGAAELYITSIEKSVGADGKALFQKWLDDNDVRINPRYGVSLADSVATPADTSLSFAVSATAKQATADTPDTTYAATLPQTQRCE